MPGVYNFLSDSANTAPALPAARLVPTDFLASVVSTLFAIDFLFIAISAQNANIAPAAPPEGLYGSLCALFGWLSQIDQFFRLRPFGG